MKNLRAYEREMVNTYGRNYSTKSNSRGKAVKNSLIDLMLLLNLVFFMFNFNSNTELQNLSYRVVSHVMTSVVHTYEISKSYVLPKPVVQTPPQETIVEKQKPIQVQPIEVKPQPIEQPKPQPVVPVLPKYVEFSQHTDLCVQTEISVADMNRVLDYWADHTGTPFEGKGEAFIQASKETGLHPFYILAHAAWESNWGKSYIARTKHNYFGINATDFNTYDNAYHLGDSVEQGIVVGAKWIKENYYNNDQTTLYEMIYGPKRYASAKDAWIRGISSIVRNSFNVL